MHRTNDFLLRMFSSAALAVGSSDKGRSIVHLSASLISDSFFAKYGRPHSCSGWLQVSLSLATEADRVPALCTPQLQSSIGKSVKLLRDSSAGPTSGVEPDAKMESAVWTKWRNEMHQQKLLMIFGPRGVPKHLDHSDYFVKFGTELECDAAAAAPSSDSSQCEAT